MANNASIISLKEHKIIKQYESFYSKYYQTLDKQKEEATCSQ